MHDDDRCKFKSTEADHEKDLTCSRFFKLERGDEEHACDKDSSKIRKRDIDRSYALDQKDRRKYERGRCYRKASVLLVGTGSAILTALIFENVKIRKSYKSCKDIENEDRIKTEMYKERKSGSRSKSPLGVEDTEHADTDACRKNAECNEVSKRVDLDSEVDLHIRSVLLGPCYLAVKGIAKS